MINFSSPTSDVLNCASIIGFSRFVIKSLNSKPVSSLNITSVIVCVGTCVSKV